MQNPLAKILDPLSRAARSNLSDAEALERLRPAVEAAPEVAATALSQLRASKELFGGYLADRGLRLLEAAVAGREVDPIPPGVTELYAAERQLGWMPLSQAFERLRVAVPELAVVQRRADALSRSHDAVLTRTDAEIVISGRILEEAIGEADGLVGQNSSDSNPGVRCTTAGMVVHTYVKAHLAGAYEVVKDRPVWAQGAPKIHVRWSGSFFGPTAPGGLSTG